MKRAAGLTVIEILVVLFLSTIVVGVWLRFMSIGFPVSRVTFLQTHSTETARLQLKRIAKIIREARYSDTGAYPLAETSPNRLILYANIDADAATERIRYEMVDDDFVQGVVEPSGIPLNYDLSGEKVTTLVRSLANGSDAVFTYYSGDYPTDPSPLNPTDVTEVKYIRFLLRIDADPLASPSPVSIESQVQIRNLKDNLSVVE